MDVLRPTEQQQQQQQRRQAQPQAHPPQQQPQQPGFPPQGRDIRYDNPIKNITEMPFYFN